MVTTNKLYGNFSMCNLKNFSENNFENTQWKKSVSSWRIYYIENYTNKNILYYHTVKNIAELVKIFCSRYLLWKW